VIFRDPFPRSSFQDNYTSDSFLDGLCRNVVSSYSLERTSHAPPTITLSSQTSPRVFGNPFQAGQDFFLPLCYQLMTNGPGCVLAILLSFFDWLGYPLWSDSCVFSPRLSLHTSPLPLLPDFVWFLLVSNLEVPLRSTGVWFGEAPTKNSSPLLFRVFSTNYYYTVSPPFPSRNYLPSPPWTSLRQFIPSQFTRFSVSTPIHNNWFDLDTKSCHATPPPLASFPFHPEQELVILPEPPAKLPFCPLLAFSDSFFSFFPSPHSNPPRCD